MRANNFLAVATAYFAFFLGASANAVEKRQASAAIVCPVSTDLIRCCRILSTASSIGPLLANSDITPPSGDTIIGVDCFPYPITTAQSAIVGRPCKPICCPIEYELNDGTGATACYPVIDPIA